MVIRPATITDVNEIHQLINGYAELDIMLFRSHAGIYEDLQMFHVCEEQGKVVGCCALQIIWQDLAEIKSLAVDNAFSGKGIGKKLVLDALETARELKIPKVFALTLEPAFFEKIGFERVKKEALPMKVWSDCARCSKQDKCDETALVYDI